MVPHYAWRLLHPAAWMLSLSQASEQLNPQPQRFFAWSSQTFWSRIASIALPKLQSYNFLLVMRLPKPQTLSPKPSARARIEYDFNEFGNPGKEKLVVPAYSLHCSSFVWFNQFYSKDPKW